MQATICLSDRNIRRTLVEWLKKQHPSTTETVIVMEFGFLGARADIAVVNGRMHGFEIKSDLDSLSRLRTQSPAYSLIFDRVTIVVAPRHQHDVMSLVPDWWGITVASADDGTVRLRSARRAKRNPNLDSLALSKLLWRKEAYAVLRSRGLHTGLRNQGVMRIWQTMAANIPIQEIAHEAREAIKSRYSGRSHL